MRHMNQTQRDVWLLNSQGYDLTYPRTNADLLLLKSEILKSASSFSESQMRVASRVYEAPRMVKTAAQRDTLESKLYKAVLTDLAEEESKNIRGGAKKGLSLIKQVNGLKDPLDVLRLDRNVGKDTPLDRMLKRRLAGASASDKSNLVGYLAIALKEKNISKIAQLLEIHEETAVVLILSMNGEVSPEKAMAELLKDTASTQQSRQMRTAGVGDAVQEAVKGGAGEFMGKAIPSIDVKWTEIFSKEGREQIGQFFHDIIHWMDPVEITEFEGDKILHPIEAAKHLANNLRLEFWNEIRALPITYFNYVKFFFINATKLLGTLLVSLWEGDWEETKRAITGIGSVVIITASVYLIWLAIAHFQVWLVELPRKLLLDWPLKITLFLYEKIAVGSYKLGKAALTFLTSEEAREAFYKSLAQKYNKTVEFFTSIPKSFAELFRDKSHDYMKDPDSLLSTMV